MTYVFLSASVFLEEETEAQSLSNSFTFAQLLSGESDCKTQMSGPWSLLSAVLWDREAGAWGPLLAEWFLVSLLGSVQMWAVERS